MTKKLVSFDDQAEPGEGLPAAVKAELNATYVSQEALAGLPTKDAVRTPAVQHEPILQTFSITVRPEIRAAVSTGTTYGYSLVDAATLKVTFTAPPSGKVEVELSAAGATGTSAGLVWILLDSSGGFYPGTEQAALPGKDEFQSERPLVTRHLVAALPGGAPLVPGRRYTLYWGHGNSANSGTPATTAWGNNSAVATMRVTPVSSRLDRRPINATTSSTTAARVLDMSANRKRLYGAHRTNQRIGWSDDDGATWVTPNPKPFPGGIAFMRELDNGELLVFTGTRPGDGIGPQIWRSSGFPANPATATFTAVCEHEGAAPAATGFGGGPAWWPGGIDHHGPYVVASEYGAKEGVGQMARYVWFSDDYGQTFRKCFDLAERLYALGLTGTLYGAHVHGCCYDPWWDAIWVCTGDGNGVSKSFVSFDHGETWIDLKQDQQFTSVYATSDAVVWVTDEGAPNGVYRIPRTSAYRLRSGGDPLWELVYARDWDTGLSIVGTRPYQARSLPDAPLLLPSGTGVANGQASLMVSYDGGRTIADKVWEGDYPGGSVSTSLAQIVGPTATGKYHGEYSRPDGIFSLTLEVL